MKKVKKVKPLPTIKTTSINQSRLHQSKPPPPIKTTATVKEDTVM